MTAAEFASKVDGVRQRGEGFTGLCPAHDDRRASLSFRDGERGLLVNCHAGCSVQAIADAVGVRVADLFEDDGTEKAAATPRTLVATYRYHDEAGTLLYEVLRYAPKDFRQRRPDGHGGWLWNLKGVRPVLYRLPALQAQTTIYIAEGEKDCERLATLGVPATTNSGGAGKWTEDHTRQLAAAGVRRVVVLPDNDPAGEKHGRTVARSSIAAGLEVKVVRLPNLPSKGDVSDWLDAGHGKDELAAAVKATAASTLPNLDDRPTLDVVSLADVQPEAVTWLWPGRIPRGKLTLLIGDPGQGKSYLTMDIAARVTRGATWPDGGTAPEGNVILLTAEDGLADTVRPRLDALGADPARVLAVRGRSLPDENAPALFDLARDLADLETLARKRAAVLLVIDPVSAYLGSKTDTFKDADVRRVLTPLSTLAERTDLAVVALMHLTKDAQRKVLYRGQASIAFVATARAVFALAADPDDDMRRLLLPVKMNVAPFPPGLAFRLTGKNGATAQLEWDSTAVNVDAETALAGPPNVQERGAREEAKDFLTDLLAGGPVKAEDVKGKAERTGIKYRTLRRAAEALGVVVAKEKGSMSGPWYWSLPCEGGHDAPKLATCPEGEQVDIFRVGGHLLEPGSALTESALVEVEL